jgi:hypothetical protein
MSRFCDKGIETTFKITSGARGESFKHGHAKFETTATLAMISSNIHRLRRLIESPWTSKLRASTTTLMNISLGLGRDRLRFSLTNLLSRFRNSAALCVDVSQRMKNCTGLEQLSWICSGGALLPSNGQSMKRYGVVKPIPPAPVSILYVFFARH